MHRTDQTEREHLTGIPALITAPVRDKVEVGYEVRCARSVDLVATAYMNTECNN